MPLHLSWNEDDPGIKGWIQAARDSLYVARGSIPPGYESYFQASAQYVSAHTSTAIEGNPLEAEEAMRVIVEGADPGEPAQVEKANLEEAYGWMAQLAEDKTARIDEGIIRTFNSLILKNLPEPHSRNRGRYRPGASLVIDQRTRSIRYLPPRPELVAPLMADFVSDIQSWLKDYPGAVVAGLSHFGLVSIHPFEDGNGRTARLTADMILDVTGWSADRMISISQAIHGRLSDYYRVLREVQGDEFSEDIDATEFIRFHSEALAEAADSLAKKVVLFNLRRERLAWELAGNLNERQVIGIMLMTDIGRISSSSYAPLTGSSQATALHDLNALVEMGVVIREGAGKNTRYRIAPRYMEEIEE